jgi:DNA invertase Pin-like site-specific DNA recombinase
MFKGGDMTASDGRVRALGYVRVSTTDQAERGQGLNIQRRGIREYCRSHRLVLLEILGDEGRLPAHSPG